LDWVLEHGVAERIRKIKVKNPETQIIVALVYGSYFHVTRPHTKFKCNMEKQMTNKMVILHMDHHSGTNYKHIHTAILI
jgi:hypothetical protein